MLIQGFRYLCWWLLDVGWFSQWGWNDIQFVNSTCSVLYFKLKTSLLPPLEGNDKKHKTNSNNNKLERPIYKLHFQNVSAVVLHSCKVWWIKPVSLCNLSVCVQLCNYSSNLAFSNSLNELHVSPSSVEGGTGIISDWITGVDYFQWALFDLSFNVCVKSTFLLGKTIFHKVLKLEEGVIKPLQCKKTFNVLTKSYKNTSEESHWHYF